MNTLVVAVSLVLSDAMLEITCIVRRQERTPIMELAQACDPVTLSANPLHCKYDLKSMKVIGHPESIPLENESCCECRDVRKGHILMMVKKCKNTWKNFLKSITKFRG